MRSVASVGGILAREPYRTGDSCFADSGAMSRIRGIFRTGRALLDFASTK